MPDDMPSQVFPALKLKALLNAFHCWSWAASRARSSLDIFSNPFSRLSWDSRKNKPYQRPWLKQRERERERDSSNLSRKQTKQYLLETHY